jgi:hypothetical protein
MDLFYTTFICAGFDSLGVVPSSAEFGLSVPKKSIPSGSHRATEQREFSEHSSQSSEIIYSSYNYFTDDSSKLPSLCDASLFMCTFQTELVVPVRLCVMPLAFTIRHFHYVSFAHHNIKVLHKRCRIFFGRLSIVLGWLNEDAMQHLR